MAYLIIGVIIMLGMHFFSMFAPPRAGGSWRKWARVRGRAFTRSSR